MKPLVSIITPSYNQGKFIRQTIESVLMQDYENVEYIVVDGGSKDDTLSILKEYEGKLTYISEKDNGQSDAINKGFHMAKGEIVAWLNSDDTYEPDCISRAVEEFDNNEKLGLLYGDGYIIDEEDRKVKIFEYTQEFDLWKLVNFWDYIMQPATFFRSSYLNEVGYLDVGLQYCMDWDLWIKLASVSDVMYINEILACSREYGDTKTSTGGEKRLGEITKLLQKYSKKAEPLGVISYKASTRYTKYAKGKITRFVLGRYLGYVHKRLDKRIPGKYQDGWIGEEYSFLVPMFKREISMVLISITNTELPVRIKVNEKLLSEYVFRQAEEKAFYIELPESNGELFYSIEIKCGRTIKAEGDSRKLSVRVKEIIAS